MRIARHRKLTQAGADLLLEQAGLRVRILPAKVLAHRTGMTELSVRQALSQMMAELRSGSACVHRGTDVRELAEAELE